MSKLTDISSLFADFRSQAEYLKIPDKKREFLAFLNEMEAKVKLGIEAMCQPFKEGCSSSEMILYVAKVRDEIRTQYYDFIEAEKRYNKAKMDQEKQTESLEKLLETPDISELLDSAVTSPGYTIS